MNYVQLVNAVLRRLRESEVTTVQGTGNINSYARLIGDYINDAKEVVENSWTWSHLKQTLTVNSVVGTSDYILPASGHKFNPEFAYNATYQSEMLQQTRQWMTEQYAFSTPQPGPPEYFAYNGIDNDTDSVKISVYPQPDAVYAMKFYGAVRSGLLSADTDAILVPSRPVILLATAMAMEERGESGGQPSINAYKIAESSLADEIALDAAKQEELTTWYSV